MQITIDTKKDSEHEIRKAIEFLQQFLGAQGAPLSSLNTEASQEEGIFNMFDQPTPSLEDTPEVEEETDEDPNVQIIPY